MRWWPINTSTLESVHSFSSVQCPSPESNEMGTLLQSCAVQGIYPWKRIKHSAIPGQPVRTASDGGADALCSSRC
ncbi:hypothetical protein CC2G_002614 [Coprinopsis cinerea AmutBmut pab1-1]|nr:hypothetical protein CC2G_002614 [Coprinopsis cinerea AmutBmut pab1-1]